MPRRLERKILMTGSINKQTVLADKLAETRLLTDKALSDFLLPVDDIHQRVIEAMRYSLLGGGKALRPFLILTTAQLFNVPQTSALRIGCALEMIHTYSLIHDDLPAMDNDTLRRGQPTNHIQFDEATAILAGDALLTKAFEVLSDPQTHEHADIRCLLVNQLAKSAGTNGMIGGQMMDLIGEKTPLSTEQIRKMQTMKTGALLRFACLASAFAGHATQAEIDALENYAYSIGLLFQITDDLLDIEGEAAVVGKTLHKDINAHKSTFVSLLGITKARTLCDELHQKAIHSLNIFGARADTLKDLADFISIRRK